MRRKTLVVLLAAVGAAGLIATPAVQPVAVAAQMPARTHEITLVAEPVRWEIQPGLVVDGWGYNGSTPGPMIRVTEGDRVRVTLVNRLPVPTTIHWHGIDVPIDQDGVPGLSQEAVEPGERFVYEFIATNPGTRWYHSHVDSNLQIQMGLFGAFIVDPKTPEPVTYDREFTYILSEKALDVTPAVALGQADVRNRDAGNGRGGAFTPDLFLMNGKAGTAIEPLTIAPGERVRLRLINAGNQAHAMHTHGHSFRIIATDGNPVPAAAQLVKDTVLIGSAERYDIVIEGTNPGVWMFHCHINNHSANGMVTELRYDGARPLAGGDHSIAHGPAAPPISNEQGAASNEPVAAPAAPAPAAAKPAETHPAAHVHTPPTTTPTAASASPPLMSGLAPESRETTVTRDTGLTAGDTPVMMLDDRYGPARLTVKTGATVTWIHSGNNLHTATALDGSWDSGSLERGQTFSFTFSAPGTYSYICRQHLLQGMRGTIIVEPP